MAHTAQVSFRIDEEVKRNAVTILDDLGLTMQAAITVFLKENLSGMESKRIDEANRIVDYEKHDGIIIVSHRRHYDV